MDKLWFITKRFDNMLQLARYVQKNYIDKSSIVNIQIDHTTMFNGHTLIYSLGESEAKIKDLINIQLKDLSGICKQIDRDPEIMIEALTKALINYPDHFYITLMRHSNETGLHE